MVNNFVSIFTYDLKLCFQNLRLDLVRHKMKWLFPSKYGLKGIIKSMNCTQKARTQILTNESRL